MNGTRTFGVALGVALLAGPASAAGPRASAAPVLVACRGHEATLEAEWRPDGSLRPLHGEFTRAEPDSPFPADGKKLGSELKALAKALRGAAWFRPGAGAAPRISFPSPRLEDEETDACVERVTDLRLALGPCALRDDGAVEDEWLATTVPLAPLAPAPARADGRIRDALAKLGLGKVDRLDVRRIPGRPALLEARFAGIARAPRVVVDPSNGAERKVPARLEGWALFGGGAEPLAAKVLTADDPETELPPAVAPATAEVGDAEWSAIAREPGVRVGIIRFARGSGGVDGDSTSDSGFWIVRVGADGRVRVEELVTEADRPC